MVGEKLERKYDGHALYLELRPPKAKTFRMDFAIVENGKSKRRTYTIGRYPQVSLAQARKKALEIKELVAKGINPVEYDKQQLIKNTVTTFKSVAEEYIDVLSKNVAEPRIKKLNGLLKNYIYPAFANTDIKDITRTQLLSFGLDVDKSGKKTVAEDTLGLIKCVLDYAMDKGLIEYFPYSASIKKHLKKHIETNHPHVKISEIPKLLADINNSKMKEMTRIGLKLNMLLFARAGELRFAKWNHIDWDNCLLTIPSMNMKGVLHVKESGLLERQIALAPQSIALLEKLRDISGNKAFLFASNSKEGVISDATLSKALRTMGYRGKQDVHGFRGLASTYLNEAHPEYREVVELCLAHKVGDDVQRAYDHSKRMKEKREVWQIWADFLTSQGLTV